MLRRLTLLLVACIATSSVDARDLRCLGPAVGDAPGKLGIPLPGERLVRVPQSQQGRALSLFGPQNLRRLSDSEALDLLQMPALPSADELLNHQLATVQEKADQCREMAAEPFFASSKERLLDAAAAYDRFAQYVQELPRRLYPYLVKSQVGFEGTGGYSIFLRQRTLIVSHGSLGHRSVEPTLVAVVVFCESEVDDASVNYSVAE